MTRPVPYVKDLNWGDAIEVAMIRGGSPYRVGDVLRWLRDGNASFAACGDMHGSIHFLSNGTAEIGHVGGAWNDKDAAWLYDRLQKALLQRGVTDWNWSGRKGWTRFLQSKGWI
jgi:hypothetical protein